VKPSRQVWEGFAQRNAEFYISAAAPEKRAVAGDDRFFSSGRRDAELILRETEPWLRRRGVAVDLGAGVGRVALAMARHFEAVVAVDVSPTMLAMLRDHCERACVSNVRALPASASWHERVAADLVYSTHVLQHIADEPEIRSCLARTRECLEPGGVAYLHFDTRPDSLLYELRNRLPDRILPRLWRRGIRRIRRSRARVIELLAEASFHVVGEASPDSADHAFVVVPATRANSDRLAHEHLERR
jgi:ubiquinone/menaquinone biosynthesis C-methylase UbiE